MTNLPTAAAAVQLLVLGRNSLVLLSVGCRFPIFAVVKGKLLEINERLTKNPDLLYDRYVCGYVCRYVRYVLVHAGARIGTIIQVPASPNVYHFFCSFLRLMCPPHDERIRLSLSVL